MHLRTDLHIHSTYARGASRDLDVEHIALWALRKGIQIVGTGDVTHPAWLEVLQRQLTPIGDGLFQLQPALAARVAERAGVAPAQHDEGNGATAGLLRFMLTVEVSTIFTRPETGSPKKINQLVCVPGWDEAKALQERLAQEGNLQADGRPLLGIDTRDLLEIILAISPRNALIPTHVFEPTRSVLGLRSGFATIEACYGDLAAHITALETGMSATPEMFSRISSLDRFARLSHSNALTPGRIGREAVLLRCEADYDSIFAAIAAGAPGGDTEDGPFAGTIEYYAEESRYYLDGHRSCKVRLQPAETQALQGQCPVCKKPLTLGVLHRVEQLADRTPEEASALPVAPAHRVIPLERILAEILDLGTKAQKVQRQLSALLSTHGPELDILLHVPLDQLKRSGIPLLTEAITRMRAGQVEIEPGYDGEYGSIRLFQEDESKSASLALFPSPVSKEKDTQLLLFSLDKPRTRSRRVPEVPAVTQLSLFKPAPTAPTPRSTPLPEIDAASPKSQEITEPLPKTPLQPNQPLSQSPSSSAQPSPSTTSTSPPRRSRVVVGKRISSSPPADEAPQASLPKIRLISPRSKSSAPPSGPPQPKKMLFMLNTEQRAAVLHQGAPMLLAAGPGTGKSRALAHRIAYLIAQQRVRPDQILALSLTPQAAQEIERHLTGLLEELDASSPHAQRSEVSVLTFSQLCLLLHQEAATEHLTAMNQGHQAEREPGREPPPPATASPDDAMASAHGPNVDLLPHILHPKESAALLQALGDARGLSLSDDECALILRQISWAKQQLLLPDDCAQLKLGTRHDQAERYGRQLESAHPAFLTLYQDFQNALRREHCMDADDLIVETVLRLQRDPSYRQKLQRRYRSIHVDEFQDINKVQWLLLRHFILDDTDFCAVGDPDQAVYHSFGGDVMYFHQFQDDFSTTTRKAVRCGLWRNYRTPERCLDAAYALIATQDDPRRIKLLAMALNVSSLPLLRFATCAEEAHYIAETIHALLHDTGAANDPPASANGWPSESSPLTPEDIVVFVQATELSQVYYDALLAHGLPLQLASASSSPESAGAEPIDESQQDTLSDVQADAGVSLLPLQAAKGREWKYVFIAGCVEPFDSEDSGYTWPLTDAEAAAERTRLLYVGMNRARQRLTLSYPDAAVSTDEQGDMTTRPLQPLACLDAMNDQTERIDMRKA